MDTSDKLQLSRSTKVSGGASPANLLYGLFVTTWYICGTLGYYTSSEQIYWAPYVLALMVFAWHVVRRPMGRAVPGGGTMPVFMVLYLAFYAIFAVTTIANIQSIEILILSLKIYVPFLLMLFFIHRIKLSEVTKKFRGLFLILPVVELPFVAHQHFFIFSRNGNWDAVVGTFGGDPNGGGSSPVMMLFTLISILVATRLVLSRQLALWKGVIVWLAALAIILLGEVKAFIFLLPLAVAIQEWRLIFQRPLTSSAIAGILLAIMVAVNGFYYETYLTSAYYARNSIWNSIFDAHNLNYITGEVGRWASVQFWWDHSEGIERWFGYGASATRSSSTVAVGLIAEKFYPLNLGATTVARLLWEGGIVSAGLFISAILCALLTALRIAMREHDQAVGSMASILSAIFAVMIPYAFYNNTAIDHAAVQLLLATCLGMLWRQVCDRKRRASGMRSLDDDPALSDRELDIEMSKRATGFRRASI